MAEQELIVLLRIVPSHSALRSHSAGARARSKHQQQSTVIAKNSTLIYFGD
jgi:hypothetical protein